MAPIPRPDKFVGGSLETGRLVLSRQFGPPATCGVLMFLGTLTDNEDSTYTLTFPE